MEIPYRNLSFLSFKSEIVAFATEKLKNRSLQHKCVRLCVSSRIRISVYLICAMMGHIYQDRRRYNRVHAIENWVCKQNGSEFYISLHFGAFIKVN